MMSRLPLLLLAAALAGGACSPSGSGSADSTGIPAGAPFLRGTLTGVQPSWIGVQALPTDSTGTYAAVFHLTPETRLVHRSGAPATPEELRIGQPVSVWVAGPVSETYPLQAAARAVVLEPLPPPP